MFINHKSKLHVHVQLKSIIFLSNLYNINKNGIKAVNLVPNIYIKPVIIHIIGKDNGNYL